jgi:hypothetical protein
MLVKTHISTGVVNKSVYKECFIRNLGNRYEIKTRNGVNILVSLSHFFALSAQTWGVFMFT